MTTNAAVAMTAWTQHRYGGPDAVALESVPLPAPGPDEVLVRVQATSLNSGDVHIMRGDPLLVRLAFGLRGPRTAVQGRDVAGVVVAVGERVTSLAVGDEVVGELHGGGLAAFARGRADRFAKRPAGVDAATAAALPIAAGTAWQALDLGGIPASGVAGDGAQSSLDTDGLAADGHAAGHAAHAPGAAPRVLVIGAGGVGTFAVRLAVLRGAVVTALVGERALPVVTGLGATTALDYRVTGLDSLPAASFDAVIVAAGDWSRLRALQRLVAPGGSVVLVSGGSGRVIGPMGTIARAGILSIGSSRPIRTFVARADTRITAQLLALAASGDLVPHIERTYRMSEGGAALAHIDGGHTIGKIVVVAD